MKARDQLRLLGFALLQGLKQLQVAGVGVAGDAVSSNAALSDACGCEVGFVNAVLDGLARGARTVEMQS